MSAGPPRVGFRALRCRRICSRRNCSRSLTPLQKGISMGTSSNGESVLPTASMSRRGFLRARIRQDGSALRPPWALDEAAFIERCTRCNACVEGCPTGIVARGAGGFPVVDFSRGECTFCAECVERCEPRALVRSADNLPPWTLRASIGERCLAVQNVECRVCGENCPQSAIRFRPRLGGVAHPALDPDACNGCGACVAPCPASAIRVALPLAASVENQR